METRRTVSVDGDRGATSARTSRSCTIGGYEVDLEGCTDSVKVLDWIAQIASKQIHSDEDVGQFVRALDDLLRLQQQLCGQGIGKTILPKRILP